MKSRFLSDVNGHPLGRVDVKDDGSQWMYSANGALLGRYHPGIGHSGTTFEANGSVAGSGNLLGRNLPATK